MTQQPCEGRIRGDVCGVDLWQTVCEVAEDDVCFSRGIMKVDDRRPALDQCLGALDWLSVLELNYIVITVYYK